MEHGSTIFALSSGRPPAAIAVIRISGSAARVALETLIGRIPEPRRAILARLRDPARDVLVDEGLALWFPGPRSETGEDMVELHVHGGRTVIAAVIRVLECLPGFRPAEAGEFTRRAFENGRMDLTAVEGLADLIFAETEAQRRQAMLQLGGGTRKRAEEWRQRCIEIMALAEAAIDFSDEPDVPQRALADAAEAAATLREEIYAVLSDEGRGERLRDGITVAIAGPANAGKSSLLNRVARREAAIVSPIAGTTRDIIEVHLDLDGYPVTLLDTAGIRDPEDAVEAEGVRRALARAQAADLVLWVTDATSSGAAPPSGGLVWRIDNKIDLLSPCALSRTERPSRETPAPTFRISALTGEGVDEMVRALAEHARELFEGFEPSLVTRARQRSALNDAVAALDRALSGANAAEELFAEEIRLASRALGRLTGRVDIEEVLDVIFRDFCVGK
jgi:tRNA modification GTPase